MKLPDYQALGKNPNVDSNAVTPQIELRALSAIGDGGAAIGRGLEKIADGFDEVQKRKDTLEMSKALADEAIARNKLNDKFTWEKDQDSGTWGARHEAESNATIDGISQRFSNPAQAALFRERARANFNNDNTRIQERHNTIKTNLERVEHDQAVDTVFNEKYKPDEGPAAAGAAAAMIDKGKEGGIYTPAQAAVLAEKYRNHAGKLDAADFAKNHPEAAAAYFRGMPMPGGRGAVSGSIPGLVEPGNIDLGSRPTVKNADGSVSTVRSTSVNIDGKEVLIPTVSADGKTLTTEAAIEQYNKTGKHLGIFNTPEAATAYAKRLSEAQGKAYAPGSSAPSMDPGDLSPTPVKATIGAVGRGASFAPVPARNKNPNLDINAPVLAAATRAGEILGSSLRITSGNDGGHSHGSQHYQDNAIDVSVRDKDGKLLPASERAKIAVALAQAGFTGIHENNSNSPHIHADMGHGSRGGRIWRGEIQTPEVAAALEQAGFVNGARVGGPAANPLFRNLTAEQRVHFAEMAEREMEKRIRVDSSELKGKVEGSVAEAMRTGTTTQVVPESEFTRVLGPDGQKAYQDYTTALQTGADKQRVSGMSPDEQARLLKSYSPEGKTGPEYLQAAARQDIIATAMQKARAERDADPALYAVSRLPVVQEAWKKMAEGAAPELRPAAAQSYARITTAEQLRIGVSPNDVKILPKAYVDQLVEKLANPQAAGGQMNVAQLIEQEAALWGKSAWGQVLRQISPNTEPLVRVLGSGVKPQAARILVEIANVSLTNIIKDEDTEKRADILKATLTVMQPYAKSMIGDTEALPIFNDFRTQAEKLTAYYVVRGDKPAAAAAKAYEELIGFKYDFADTYRIPKSAAYSADDIRQGVQAVKENLGKIEFHPPRDRIGGLGSPYLKASPGKTYARDGIWATEPENESGLMLTYADEAVRMKNGKPYIVSWADLAKAGRERPGGLTVFNMGGR